MIRPAEARDAAAIASIYNPYILNTDISFETEPVEPAEVEARMARVTSRYPWLVHEEDGALTGYAYASRWKERAAYHFCAETTIYLRQDATGRGIGRKLYTALLDLLPECDVRVALGCITIPNPASVSLHESLGFRLAARFPAVGYKFNRWIDIGYWRKDLARAGADPVTSATDECPPFPVVE